MNFSASPGMTNNRAITRLAPWLCLAAAICWSVLLRFPLILNAPIHLDSDLAVDGLTLQEAVGGHWRWHYPGTPYMGTGAVLLSFLQARIWGTGPETLVSGGTVAHVLIMGACFALAWRVCGPGVAIWSLVPLTFASTGLLWLSGRITGGHLLIVAWSAWAWLLVYDWLLTPGWRSAIALGFWCGLGFYLDSMFLLTLAGIVVSGLIAARQLRVQKAHCMALILAFLAGAAPRAIGRWVEPHDAYNEQFSWSLDSRLLAAHSQLLFFDCLPRLIAGHRLPGLESDPDPALLGTGAPIQRKNGSPEGPRWWTVLLTVVALGSFTASIAAVVTAALFSTRVAERAIALGMLAMAAAAVGSFLVNRNIFNSDNYRYLVLLLVPWALGLGLTCQGTLHHSRTAGWAVVIGTVVFAVLFTCDAAAWYRRLGWIDEGFRPIRRNLDDPALSWLADHPEVRAVYGSYWDVYRLSFLTAGQVKGVPFPIFPNRFPEWSMGLAGGRPETLLVRRSSEGQQFLNLALREGGRVVYRQGGLLIVDWPRTAPVHGAW
jgi:hypothetical protein